MTFADHQSSVSGIHLAHLVKERLKDVEFVIYEKNHELGGTWLENHYPGYG
jgi:cation diffusion facilitator CzcD-associated flavoprotein CzcO